MTSSSTTPGSDGISAALRERARRIAHQASRLVGFARGLAWAALASALWLWCLMFVWPGGIAHWSLMAPALIIGILMLLPAGLVLLLTVGLRGLAGLPRKLGMAPAAASTPPDSPHGVARWRPFRLIRGLFELRGLMLGYKALLIRYVGAVRLFTVPFLLVVVAALVLAVLQIIAAVLSLPVVIVLLMSGH